MSAKGRPRSEEDHYDHVGSVPTTHKNPEPAITENAKTTTNKKPGNAVTKNPRPADGQSGSRISSPHDLTRVWQELLDEKFSQTDLERARVEFAALPESKDAENELTREEFDQTVRHMKSDKTTDMDNIPSEVWKHSKVTQDALYEFIEQVWSKEYVPTNLALCIFVMIYKRKGSPNDCSKYRVIGRFAKPCL